jgi:tetrahydromethanopterin S-methyltransferase subunit F
MGLRRAYVPKMGNIPTTAIEVISVDKDEREATNDQLGKGTLLSRGAGFMFGFIAAAVLLLTLVLTPARAETGTEIAVTLIRCADADGIYDHGKPHTAIASQGGARMAS